MDKLHWKKTNTDLNETSHSEEDKTGHQPETLIRQAQGQVTKWTYLERKAHYRL